MLTLNETPGIYGVGVGHNSGEVPIKRLPDALAEVVRRFLANKLTRAALEKAIPADKQTILDALAGSATAIAGPFRLTRKDVQPVGASLRLRDGRTVKLADVKGFSTHDGKRFSAEDIVSVFGGRNGYADIGAQTDDTGPGNGPAQ